MNKTKLSITIVALSILTACGSDNDNVQIDNNPVVGYIYTTTNGSGDNKVLQLSRHSDGTLSDEIAYDTMSLGGANVAAGGDATGDFDTQSALRIINDYLLTVNAGGNEVSVFKINKDTGALTFSNNIGSGGARPVSISFTPKVTNGIASSTEFWVVVGNQWNNPNVQKSSANVERYPDNDGVNFFRDSNGNTIDLETAHQSDSRRNIVLFSFNSDSGILTKESLDRSHK